MAIRAQSGAGELASGSGVVRTAAVATAASGRLDHIQVLRFIAALMVVFVHVPTLGFGHWGVDIFFAISGFIMMYTTEAKADRFFLRRVIRVVPIYWIFTLGVFAIAMLAPGLLNNTTADPIHLIKSLLFIPFDKNGTGHFPVLFVGWTLNFEFVFYSLFACALLISHRFRFHITAALILCLIALSSALADRSFVFEVYANGMLFEFVFGMLIYVVWSGQLRRRVTPTAWTHLLFLLPIVCVPVIGFEARWLHFGIPTALFVAYAVFCLGHVRVPRGLILLGDASFALYLTHAYVIQAADKVLNLFHREGGVVWLASALSVLLAVGVSVLVFLFLEKPMTRALRRRLTPP